MNAEADETSDSDEIERFQSALDLTEGFAFHVIVAGSLSAFESALKELPAIKVRVKPRPDRALPRETAARLILDELNDAIDRAKGEPLLVDALIAHQVPAWALVFRRLNELRNGIEQRHAGLFILAVAPKGETLLGREAPDLWSRRGSGMRLGHRRQRLAASKHLEWVSHLQSPIVFQELCLRLFREIWDDPGAFFYHGSDPPWGLRVDIIGKSRTGWTIVHFPKRQLRQGEKFQSYIAQWLDSPAGTFVIASFFPLDPEFRQYVRELSLHTEVEVEVWGWEDILDAVLERPEVAAWAREQGLLSEPTQSGELEAAPVELDRSSSWSSLLQDLEQIERLLEAVVLEAQKPPALRSMTPELRAQLAQALSRAEDLRERTSLEPEASSYWALAELITARARLCQLVLTPREESALVKGLVSDSIATVIPLLREKGPQSYLPAALLTRAWLRHYSGDIRGVRLDLDEAEAVARKWDRKADLAEIAAARERFV